MTSSSGIPTVKDLCFDLMGLHRGERLGTVLITRIPPGGKVYPHVDNGWAARYYDKYLIPIVSDGEQRFYYEGESHITYTGEYYWFKNNVTHWVNNDSDKERISLIVTLRSDKRDFFNSD